MAASPLIEYRLHARETYGQRVFPDGRVEEWDGSDDDDDDDDAAWRPLTQLSDDEVERIKAGLDDSGFFALRPLLDSPTKVRDGMTATWRVSYGGHRHTVVARGTGLEAYPVLQKLNDLLQLVIGQALNRAADAS